jgi:hypothetical protein
VGAVAVEDEAALDGVQQTRAVVDGKIDEQGKPGTVAVQQRFQTKQVEVRWGHPVKGDGGAQQRLQEPDGTTAGGVAVIGNEDAGLFRPAALRNGTGKKTPGSGQQLGIENDHELKS